MLITCSIHFLELDIDLATLEASAKDELQVGVHIPQCNRDAAHVSQVYNINDIIPENILVTLYEEAEKFFEADLTG